ncbi:hypothetical protein DFH28DRAFT_1079759 [Melampsora americana]|nr:hypothetical protein DFH28DRAFT_1079759 [Melampsora americana]
MNLFDDEDDEVFEDDEQPQASNLLGHLGSSQLRRPASTPRPSRNTLKKFGDILKLSKDNRECVQQLYESTQPHEEFAATLSYLAYLGQEGLSSGTKWIAGKHIWETFKKKVARFIFEPTLQAFSTTVAADRTVIINSLELLTFEYLKILDPEFIEEYGSGDYIAGDACIPGTLMHLFIKDTLKNKRSKVRTELLTNILGIQEGSVLLVPSARSIVVQVAHTFLPDLAVIEEDKAVRNTLGNEEIKWIVFMTVMDKILAQLRAKPGCRDHYFNTILGYDQQVFDGKQTWADVQAIPALPSPAVAEVIAQIHANNTTETRRDSQQASPEEADESQTSLRIQDQSHLELFCTHSLLSLCNYNQ